MEQRIYHGNIKPRDVANAMVAHFNRGNWRPQIGGDESNLKVQIATRPGANTGGETALTVFIREAPDGVMVQIGQQAWLGVAASLGQSAIATFINPWNLLGRLDDIAQDIENLQMESSAWKIVEKAARSAGVSKQLSERYQRTGCSYCGTANPVGQPNCVSCGAPMGDSQPVTCSRCGFVLHKNEPVCPNCGAKTS